MNGVDNSELLFVYLCLWLRLFGFSFPKVSCPKPDILNLESLNRKTVFKLEWDSIGCKIWSWRLWNTFCVHIFMICGVLVQFAQITRRSLSLIGSSLDVKCGVQNLRILCLYSCSGFGGLTCISLYCLKAPNTCK